MDKTLTSLVYVHYLRLVYLTSVLGRLVWLGLRCHGLNHEYNTTLRGLPHQPLRLYNLTCDWGSCKKTTPTSIAP